MTGLFDYPLLTSGAELCIGFFNPYCNLRIDCAAICYSHKIMVLYIHCDRSPSGNATQLLQLVPAGSCILIYTML